MKIVPSWGDVLKQINNIENPLDEIRRKYLRLFHEYTGRNVVAYYSAFIQKTNVDGLGINENDKNAFMQAMCGLDRSKGLDLILHTPGGAIASTESIVYYLHEMFGRDIRVFVPQIAMSAGTMIALSAKEIVMGKQSNLGPIDPQMGTTSCAAAIEEFYTALKEINENPASAQLWGLIISKYPVTLLGECKKAIAWSESMVKDWLSDNMFYGVRGKDVKIKRIVDFMSSHNDTYSHSKHIHMDKLLEIGLKVLALEGMDDTQKEDCKDFQDCVLTLHHSYMQSLSQTNASKIVENHLGQAMIMIGRPIN